MSALKGQGGSQAVLAALDLRDLTPLLDEVCRRRGVVPEEVCGRARTLSVSRARQELWWLIRNQPERRYSLAEIALLFRRDHTTVHHGIRAHQRRAVP
jgi:chromosomal replication initiation ATPase DnaA